MTRLSLNELEKLTCKAAQVTQIIKPMQVIDITGVFYERIYPDGTSINLASDADCTKFHFEKVAMGAYKKEDIADLCFNKHGISLSALNIKNQMWLDVKHNFGHGNGIILSKSSNKFREVIGFYSTANNHAINDFYVNELNTMKELSKYFVLQAADMIKELEQDKIFTPHKVYIEQELKQNLLNHFDKKTTIDISKLTDVSDIIHDKILIFNKKSGLPMYLTQQRSRCFLLLAQGNSIKQIAHAMTLTPKTIEHYLEILRKELGCRSSKELIAVYGEQLLNRGISPY